MTKLMGNFLFTDENNNKMVFYRPFYYELICLIVTDILEKPLKMNKLHSNFIAFLENIQDYQDVYFLTSEMPYYWAICIAENEKTTSDLNIDKKALFFDFYNRFTTQKGIQSFLEEANETPSSP